METLTVLSLATLCTIGVFAIAIGLVALAIKLDTYIYNYLNNNGKV